MPKNMAHVCNLVLEITRRCNMACAHCLRGDAEDLDMAVSTIREALRPVRGIGTLTFTGGEPSLRPEAMWAALNLCKEKEIPVEGVYIATNGKKVTDSFLAACRAWDEYALMSSNACPEKLKHAAAYMLVDGMRRSIEDELAGCRVALSMDAYHEAVPAENIMRLMSGTRLVTDKYADPVRDAEKYVIREGRAADNGIGGEELRRLRSWEFEPILEIEEYGPSIWHVEQVMVCADEGIMHCCDASYATQREARLFLLSDLDKTASPAETWLDRAIKMKKEYENG